MSMDSKKNRPLLLLLALLLAFVLVGATVLLTGAAPARVVDVPDAAPTSAANNVSENTPQTSHRLIVQLESPSLAEHSAQEGVWRTENGRLDFNAPEAQAYIAQLEAEQKAFIGEMQTAVPTLSIAGYINESGQAVAATYQIVFNGVAIDAGKAATLEQAQRELLKIEGTRAVYRDYAHYPQTYTSTQLINAPVVWNMAGGQGNAGTGVKVASMDGGLHHDAPMFDGSGWSYPPGWPAGGLGDSANNNGKIIASRAYFRDWDPPAPGDENSWPGVAGISHGTHTGSTAAGNHAPQDYLGVPVDVTGVAPGAWLMSYRVFYASVTDDGSFYNVEGIAALEDLVADGADVVNNSWGEGPGSGGGPFDPLDQALVNASTAGVFVSMATGNSGPGNGTADHPSDDYINVAASTTDGTFLAGKASVPISATLQDMPLGKARFGPPLPAMVVTYSYTAAISVEPGNYRGCSPFTGTPFAGGAALISHGSCSYGNKVYYAQQAGAQFVIIYNHAGDSVRKMGFSCNYSSTCSASDITISAIFIGQSNGEAMVNIFDNDRPNAIVVVDNIAYQAGNTPDQIASFSSRGPGVGNVLKPDIAAPGVIIMAQGYDPLATGEARHLGIAQASGTSMAAPHVAGAATILRQLYPTWTNAQIKSALMSTSKYIDIYNEDGSPAQPLDMGAGRLDLTNAADPGIFLDPPSLSFGQMVTGTTSTIDVTLTNVTTATETYSVTTLYTGDGFTATMPVAGLTVSPTMVTLTPGGSTTVQAMFDAAMSMGIGDNQGYVAMSGDNGHNAHMPAWARIVPLPDAEVLIIDADASPGLGFPDYLSYYTAVLDNLSLTYDILDWATTGIPEQAVLAPYKTIILFTGDFNLANNVTKIEMDHLTEYANSGGIILAMGQDMTDVLGTTFFRKSVLGIPSPLQDSVTNGLLPDAAVVTRPDALPAFAGVNLDLSGPEVNSVTLTGANEVPPVATTMIGTADFGYDNANQVLDYDVTVTVSNPVTIMAAHIHTGTAGVNGGVLATVFSTPTWVTDTLSFSGQATIPAGSEAALLSGGLYVNVHSTDVPSGEIRGQVDAAVNGDGAANQYYIDEIQTWPNIEPNPVPGWPYPYTPLFTYSDPSNYLAEGTVGMAHRAQPSLEYPGVYYDGRSIFTSFGLEGVNDGTGGTERSDLLDSMLTWAMDDPVVMISQTTSALTTTSQVVTFNANVSGGNSYRWDFGDGSAYAGPYSSSQTSHTYTVCGSYTVRVEAVNNWGNAVIGQTTTTIDVACAYTIILPIIMNP